MTLQQNASHTLEMCTDTIFDASPSAPMRGVQERNLRTAFAVLGELVAEEAISFDLDDHRWAARFELTVLGIARVLNQHGA